MAKKAELRAHRLQQCWRETHEADPTKRGTITWTLHFEEGRSPRIEAVEDTLQDPAFVGCALRHLERLSARYAGDIELITVLE